MATRAEAMRKTATKHGLSGTRTHAAWKRMRMRSADFIGKETSCYAHVTCCERWADFLCFLEDMGEIPEGMSLDRIDNSKGYEPGNCRWATVDEQARNRTRTVFIEYAGRRQCAADWAKEIGLTGGGVIKRLRAGWPIEAVLQPNTRPRRVSP